MRIGRSTISDDEQPWTGVVLPTEGIVVHIAEAGQAAGIPLPPESVSLLKGVGVEAKNHAERRARPRDG